mmetsp:Transcript_27851/g.54430  ORF Transcript_27851/g.54430 Transcript_27851/m.54430 type:complete len:141 (-) Transcript_27851:132-554(-)
MKSHDSIIPTRFMCTMSFLVATIMILSTMTENVVASLPKTYSPAQFDANNTSCLLAIIVTLVCIGVNLAGFLGGFSMFIPAVNVLVVVSHTVGCIYTCVAIMEAWHFLNLWYIFAFFAGPVALLELCIITGTFCLGGMNV